jgi:superfamily II DNA or RNA helicase
MSIVQKLHNISYENRVEMGNDLEIKIEGNKYSRGKITYFSAFSLKNDDIYLPFAYGVKKLKIGRPPRWSFIPKEVKFESVLYEDQQIVHKDALKYLSSTGSIMLSLYTGAGKTAISISLACSIKLPTLVLVHTINMISQWKDEILKFCPNAIVQMLDSTSELEEADFYIMYGVNVTKKHTSFFSSIGCLIVDETHLLMAEKVSNLHKNICPRYLIGLSATPYRMDELNSLIPLYYGKNQISKQLYHEHLVYKVDSGFTPEFSVDMTGKIIWGTLLESQANDENRNTLIKDLIVKFKDRNFLVLVKRVSQGEWLVDQLTKAGEHVTSLIKDQQTFDKTARILIGTTQKISTGFSHSKLDTLLLGADVEQYFIQILGRVFRSKEVKPIIFDIVDKHRTLVKHFNTRKQVYTKAGGKIIKFDPSKMVK